MICNCGSCGATMAPRGAGLSRHATHEGRGLCTPCYERANYRGELADYPRRTWSRDELMTEWDMLRSENYTRAQAADRLGIARATLDRALWRAKAAGDQRAVPGVAGGIHAHRANDVEPARWSPATSSFGDDHAMAH